MCLEANTCAQAPCQQWKLGLAQQVQGFSDRTRSSPAVPLLSWASCLDLFKNHHQFCWQCASLLWQIPPRMLLLPYVASNRQLGALLTPHNQFTFQALPLKPSLLQSPCFPRIQVRLHQSSSEMFSNTHLIFRQFPYRFPDSDASRLKANKPQVIENYFGEYQKGVTQRGPHADKNKNEAVLRRYGGEYPIPSHISNAC